MINALSLTGKRVICDTENNLKATFMNRTKSLQKKIAWYAAQEIEVVNLIAEKYRSKVVMVLITREGY